MFLNIYFLFICSFTYIDICPSFRPYQQEDAHEFLLGLLSRMEDSVIHGLRKISEKLYESNVIRQIFGGVMRSEGKLSNLYYYNKTDNCLTKKYI